MKDIRVLITTYQSAFLRPGGGEAELNNLVDVLHQLGISADVYGATSMMIDAYDVVLHFSVHGESLEFIRSIKAAGKKLILWPNLWWKQAPDAEGRNFVRGFLELADAVIFKSGSELDNVAGHLSLDAINYYIVPWHIDSKYLTPVKSGYFSRLYGLDRYILWVGVIEEGKSQLAAIEALGGIDVPLVFIGYHRDKAYFDRCREAARADTLFLPFMRQGSDVLRSAYNDCSVYLELSGDPAGLSALEAALYEKPMVISRNGWSVEEFGSEVALVDPGSRREILDAVRDALSGRYVYAHKNEIIRKHLTPASLDTLVDLINELTKED